MPLHTLRQLASSTTTPALDPKKLEDVSWEVALLLPASLRCFEGHFPEAPLMPGIAQMILVRELVSLRLGQHLTLHQVVTARMTEPLLPNDTCRITLQIKRDETAPGWRVTAQLYKDQKRCTRLTLRLHPASG